VRDVRATYARTLSIVSQALKIRPDVVTKSSLMLGLGETEAEVVQALRDLRSAGVSIVTLGQYLRPSEKHLPVKEYVSPERFEGYAEIAREMGYLYVASGPLVRSSYKAAELFLLKKITGEDHRVKDALPVARGSRDLEALKRLGRPSLNVLS
jgi:lipoyl synthase